MKGPKLLVVLACGALFGVGLALSTMVRPEVVLAFLTWSDFGLMLVLGGAASIAALAYTLAPRIMRRPMLGGDFGVHPSVLNRDTIVGAAIFGAGWGLSGVCPGPAIASIGVGNWPVLWALAGIAIGAWVQGRTATSSR